MGSGNSDDKKTPEARFSIEITGTKNKCPVGEKTGRENLAGGKIPVLSCEGACIRGEIARLAANLVGKGSPTGAAATGSYSLFLIRQWPGGLGKQRK